MQVLQSNRANFHTNRLIEVPEPDNIEQGQIKVRVERFSFTTNNITYAVMGDTIKYWSFFPALHENGDDASSQWGLIPVWGFASVVASNCEEIEIGHRFFGYFPPAEHWVMNPTNINNGSFIDGSEHRLELPAGYNIYRAVAAHSTDTQADNERSLLYPLFVTAYCIHDMMKEQAWREAEQVVIISASSKTSIGLAYAMQADAHAPSCIGLTSERNRDAVDALGLYDSVSTYDDIESLNKEKTTTIIDMSGNRHLLSGLHQHFGENMVLTLNVGITHSADLGNASGINHERSEQFFAPSQIQRMIKRLGMEEFERSSSDFIKRSANKTRAWLQCKELQGLSALQSVYDDVCQGQVNPNVGLIVVMD